MPAAAATRPSAPADAPCPPPPAGVPDWSPATRALLADLTPLQRAFAEWYACGYSAAEAYRRASGRGGNMDRQSAYQVKGHPAVREAIQACLGDRNFGARMDREWKLQVVFEQVSRARQSRDPRMLALIPRFLRLAAELQGEVGQTVAPKDNPAAGKSDIRERMDRLIAQAKRHAAPAVADHQRPAATPPAA